MDVMDYIGTDFGTATAALFLGALAAALRFGVKFDLNKYLEGRRKRHRKLAQAACPHMTFGKNSDGVIYYQSCFISPPGTILWYCKRCGAERCDCPDEDEVREAALYFSSSPKKYRAKMRECNRHARKSI